MENSSGKAPPAGEGAGGVDALLAEQRRYYEQRAPEYDDWWQRRGRYDLGERDNARWFAEVEQMQRWLAASLGSEDLEHVLEIAGGTGNFTLHLARLARHVTVLDAAPATAAIARRRLEQAGLAERVTHQIVDVFGWQPRRQYDAVTFTFWLSHVPEARRAAFFGSVVSALRPGGLVAIIDSRVPSRSGPADGQRGERQTRELSDGQRFEIVKRYDDPSQLERELAQHGLRAEAGATDFFVYCRAQLATAATDRR